MKSHPTPFFVIAEEGISKDGKTEKDDRTVISVPGDTVMCHRRHLEENAPDVADGSERFLFSLFFHFGIF